MDCNLHFQKPREILFHVEGQEIGWPAIAHLSLSRGRPNFRIGAWQNHLKEVWVIQFSILVGVKEFDNEVEVCLSHFHDSIFSHEVDKVHGSYKSIFISI